MREISLSLSENLKQKEHEWAKTTIIDSNKMSYNVKLLQIWWNNPVEKQYYFFFLMTASSVEVKLRISSGFMDLQTVEVTSQCSFIDKRKNTDHPHNEDLPNILASISELTNIIFVLL